MDSEAKVAAQESGLTYDEAKEIALSYLVLVNKLQGTAWVPDFVGRSDLYVVNKVGGLARKNRRVNPEWMTSCTTTNLRFDLRAFTSTGS